MSELPVASKDNINYTYSANANYWAPLIDTVYDDDGDDSNDSLMMDDMESAV